MSGTPSDLTALISSRICHDLISPLGAIGNGIELLQLSDTHGGPEVALIAESAENANLRIRYFRVAFGAAEPGQIIAEKEIRAVLPPARDGRKTDITWHPQGDLARNQVKLAFLILQCFDSAMAFGGRIDVSQNEGQWRIDGQADRLKIEAELWALLTTPNQNMSLIPAQVQFGLVGPELARQNRVARVTFDEGRISVGF